VIYEITGIEFANANSPEPLTVEQSEKERHAMTSTERATVIHEAAKRIRADLDLISVTVCGTGEVTLPEIAYLKGEVSTLPPMCWASGVLERDAELAAEEAPDA